MAEQTGVTPIQEFRRTDDFASVYANNVQFEASAIDLKVIFGELDLRGGKVAVEQHTSVTISWFQAKLLNFLLEVSLALHELEYGKIIVPPAMHPPVFPPIPAHLADNPLAKTMHELVNKMREEFIASL